jgi:hypothetical protein
MQQLRAAAEERYFSFALVDPSPRPLPELGAEAPSADTSAAVAVADRPADEAAAIYATAGGGGGGSEHALWEIEVSTDPPSHSPSHPSVLPPRCPLPSHHGGLHSWRSATASPALTPPHHHRRHHRRHRRHLPQRCRPYAAVVLGRETGGAWSAPVPIAARSSGGGQALLHFHTRLRGLRGVESGARGTSALEVELQQALLAQPRDCSRVLLATRRRGGGSAAAAREDAAWLQVGGHQTPDPLPQTH